MSNWSPQVGNHWRDDYLFLHAIPWIPGAGNIDVHGCYSLALVLYSDVIMSKMKSQITSLTIVYSTFYSRADQRKHKSSTTLAFVRGIQRWPVNSPHKAPVTRKMFPSDDIIMVYQLFANLCVQEQSTDMTSQYQYPVFARREMSTVVTSQYLGDNVEMSDRWLFSVGLCVRFIIALIMTTL